MVVQLAQRPISAHIRPAQQRRVSHQGQPRLGAQIAQQVPIGDPDAPVPRAQSRLVGPRTEVRVVMLQHLTTRQTQPSGDRPGALDLPGPMVAQPHHSDRALGGQRAERLHLVLQRHRGIGNVGVVDVDPVAAQVLQAAFRRLLDHLRRQPLEVLAELLGRSRRSSADLGRDRELVAQASTAQPAAEQLLALAALGAVDPERVVVGGVNERAARLDVPVEDPVRRGLVSGRAHQHRAERELAHPAAAGRVGSQCQIAHVVSRPPRPRSRSTPARTATARVRRTQGPARRHTGVLARIRSGQTRCAVSEHLPTGLSSVAVAQ
jgi:hypothetical protein